MSSGQEQTDVVFAVSIVSVHQLQQLNLNLCLVVERLLVLDDLDGNVLLVYQVIGLHHLHTSTTQ